MNKSLCDPRNISNDILKLIAYELESPSDFLSFRLVCSAWNKSVSDESYFEGKLWRRKLRRSYLRPMLAMTTCVKNIIQKSSFEVVKHGFVDPRIELVVRRTGTEDQLKRITATLVGGKLHGVMYAQGDQYRYAAVQLMYEGSMGLRILQLPVTNDVFFLKMDNELKLSCEIVLKTTNFSVDQLADYSLEEAIKSIVYCFEANGKGDDLAEEGKTGEDYFWQIEFQRLLAQVRKNRK